MTSMGKKTRRIPGTVERQPTGWSETVAICRKCSRKLDGGFGEDGKQPLRGALREALRVGGRRGTVGLVDIGCLGICPKGAVTVLLASAPGEVLVVSRGAAAAAILDRRPPGAAP